MQYADDCIMFLNDKDEQCTALNILRNYGKISGLTLNLSKCEGLWLGKDKGRLLEYMHVCCLVVCVCMRVCMHV